jgi:short-subunit dehydrogenase
MHIESWLKENFRKGERVLITGSTSGIGYCYAETFASLGCDLICISNEEAPLQKIKNQFETKYKINIINIVADLRDPEGTIKSISHIKDEKVRVLVNNAGVGIKGRFESNNLNSYIDLIKINTIAPVIFLHQYLPSMQKDNLGLIFNVASINALVPIPNNQVYTATKAFLSSLASAVARENKESKIKFQLVLPGTTNTPFHDRQGVQPKNLVMMPEDVVKASLTNIEKQICIPNKWDKVLPFVARIMPLNSLMDIAAYLLKKRLGL